MGNTYVFEDMANTLAQRDYKQPQAVILWRKEDDSDIRRKEILQMGER